MAGIAQAGPGQAPFGRGGLRAAAGGRPPGSPPMVHHQLRHAAEIFVLQRVEMRETVGSLRPMATERSIEAFSILTGDGGKVSRPQPFPVLPWVRPRIFFRRAKMAGACHRRLDFAQSFGPCRPTARPVRPSDRGESRLSNETGTNRTSGILHRERSQFRKRCRPTFRTRRARRLPPVPAAGSG